MLKPGEKTQLTTRSNETRGVANTEGGVSGIKGMRDLSYKLVFVGINIKVENNQFDEFDKEEEEVERGKDDPKPDFDEGEIYDNIVAKLSETEIKEIEKIK
jgi:hypothetical protein